jgi:nucleoside-diphosphate-sugar epimerase
MRIRRWRKTAMAGKSSFLSGCADTTWRISGCTCELRVSTTFTGHGVRGLEAARRLQRRFAARWSKRRLRARTKFRYWGNGHQTRSFMYVDDCIKGVEMIMDSSITEPINLGSSEAVRINQLVDMVEGIAGIKLERRYELDAPKGVIGRNSDNTLIHKYLGWEPSFPLRTGLEKTYAWIYDQYRLRERGAAGVVRETLAAHS